MSISVEEIQDWEAELSVSPLKVTEGLDVPEEKLAPCDLLRWQRYGRVPVERTILLS